MPSLPASNIITSSPESPLPESSHQAFGPTSDNPDPAPRIEDICKFFATLWVGTQRTSRITISGSRNRKAAHVPVAELRNAAEFAIALADKLRDDAYVGVTLRRDGLTKEQRGRRTECQDLPGFFIDIDIKGPGHAREDLPATIADAYRILADSGFRPTMVVNTSGGLHAYWLFHQCVAITDEIRDELQRALSAFQRRVIGLARKRGWHVDNTSNLDRVLRVPSTFNYKIKDNPRPVTLSFSDGPRYDLSVLTGSPGKPAKAQVLGVSSVAGTSPASVDVIEETKANLKKLRNLKNRLLMTKVLAGESIAEPGERDSALQKVVSIIAFVAPEGATAETLSMIVFPSIEAMAKAHDDPVNPALTTNDVIEKMGRAMQDASKMRAQNAATSKNESWPSGTTGGPAAPSNHSAVSPGDRPLIVISTEMTDVVDRAEAALIASESPVFSRAGRLVEIQRDGARRLPGLARPIGAPVIVALPDAQLRERLSTAAQWMSPKDGELTEKLPPPWVVESLMTRGEWRLSPLEGVIETPAFRRNGSVLDRPGYDLETGLFLEASVLFLPVPDEPTLEDAKSAVEVLAAPFVDFPFVKLSDFAVVLAAIFSILARPAIVGPVPLFAFLAHVAGAGKSLLADLVALITSGRVAARMVAPKDDEEARKRLLAVGLEGTPLILLDNVEGAFGSATLAAALTGEAFSDRLLGSSRTATVTLRAVWLLTGNNVTFQKDLGRRVVPCMIDPACEHPEDLKGFTIANPRAYVRTNRPLLVVAALTILRAFHVAGRPAHIGSRKGSYEEWDDLVRGAVIWATGDDPLAGCEELRRDADSDLATLRMVLLAWDGLFGQEALTLQKAVRRVQQEQFHDAAAAALHGVLTPLSPGCDAHEIGLQFRRLKMRVVDGRRLENAGEEKGSARWRVVRV